MSLESDPFGLPTSRNPANHSGLNGVWSDNDSFLPRAKPPPPLVIPPKENKSLNSSKSSLSSAAKSPWNDNDSFLPRAKPPPPLVLPPKESKPSNGSKSSLDSTESRRSKIGLFKARSLRFRSSQRRTDRPVVEDTPEVPVQGRPSLVRPPSPTPSSRASTSNDAGSSTSSLSRTWAPPANWSGPNEADLVEVREEAIPEQTLAEGWVARRKRANSASNAVVLDARPDSQLSDLGSIHYASMVKLEQGITITRAEVVEIQCFKGWDEKPVTDVVHQLRALRCK